jgi:hypothetical protein
MVGADSRARENARIWFGATGTAGVQTLKKFTLLVIAARIVPLGAALIVSCAPTRAPSPDKKVDQRSTNYDADEGLPQDEAGEKRRDYAVLEAALNDLCSPKNPEHKYRIQNLGPGKEVVINESTCVARGFEDTFFDLGHENRNFDGNDAQSIPLDVQVDFTRRSKSPARSLADFKAANPNIIVEDLNRIIVKDLDRIGDDHLKAISKKYPNAWNFVWAYPPGYSTDGGSAVVVFSMSGGHGGDWVYMLRKAGKRWDVVWRHLHFYM